MQKKALLFISVLILFFCALSCNKSVSPEYSPAELRVDVESDFDEDYVKIELDNENILDEIITTNYTVCAAWLSGTINSTQGKHRVSVKILNQGVSGDYVFIQKGLLTVRVMYDKISKRIKFSEYNGIVIRR